MLVRTIQLVISSSDEEESAEKIRKTEGPIQGGRAKKEKKLKDVKPGDVRSAVENLVLQNQMNPSTASPNLQPPSGGSQKVQGSSSLAAQNIQPEFALGQQFQSAYGYVENLQPPSAVENVQAASAFAQNVKRPSAAAQNVKPPSAARLKLKIPSATQQIVQHPSTGSQNMQDRSAVSQNVKRPSVAAQSLQPTSGGAQNIQGATQQKDKDIENKKKLGEAAVAQAFQRASQPAMMQVSQQASVMVRAQVTPMPPVNIVPGTHIPQTRMVPAPAVIRHNLQLFETQSAAMFGSL